LEKSRDKDAAQREWQHFTELKKASPATEGMATGRSQ